MQPFLTASLPREHSYNKQMIKQNDQELIWLYMK